jgi:NAD dependent epimerase/dehydratase family enzyme
MLDIGTKVMRTEAELVLKSRYVVPRRLLDSGFRFDYPYWPAAVRELVSRK